MLSEKIIKTIHEEFPELQNLVSSGIEAEAQKIRDMIPSGFVELGELDYDYMENNENVVKLKTKSIAYVNGYRVEIPADTIINVGKAPEKETREDLLFLEVWKDEDFLKDGQVKWRIRFVDGVDFNTHPDGLRLCGESWTPFQCYALGGATERPSAYNNYYFSQAYHRGDLDTSFGGFPHMDKGLFIAGQGTEGSKKAFNCVDGYVYAIPMFKLLRKPSCGKSKPMEYSKINPNVDIIKAQKLMGQENLEVTNSENFYGRTLHNLCLGVRSCDSSFIVEGTKVRINSPKGAGNISFNVQLKESTTYTVIVNNIENNLSIDLAMDLYPDVYEEFIALSRGYKGSRVFTFTTPKDIFSPKLFSFRYYVNGASTGECIADFPIILQGDWTSKQLPNQFFYGLKSLGQDKGNVIEISNKVVDKDSFDPKNNKAVLQGIEGLNHITSENIIRPDIEAELRRGSEKISDLTSFKQLIELQGNEQVEFNVIKGKTLHNVLGKLNVARGSSSISSNYWIANGGGVNTNCSFDLDMVKPSTKYTIIYDVRKNTLTRETGDSVAKINILNWEVEGGYISIKKGELGFKKIVITTPAVRTHNTPYIELHKDVTGGTIEIGSIVMYIGDYSSVPLSEIPIIYDIQSVGEAENNQFLIRNNGRNLFNGDKYLPDNIKTEQVINGMKFTRLDKSAFNFKGTATGDNTTIHFKVMTEELVEGKRYVLRGERLNMCLRRQDGKIDWKSDFVYSSDVYKSVEIYFQLPIGSLNQTFDTNVWATLQEYSAPSSYLPYEENKQIINLKEPLRSLPNGICDSIVGKKVVRRVGKKVFCGADNEGWGVNEGLSLTNTLAIMSRLNIKKFGTTNVYCDRFYSEYTNCGYVDEDRMWSEPNTSAFYIRISKSKLESADLNGFKKWLAQNPITILYELQYSYEEEIEPIYTMESKRTYQLSEPLRGLPDGISDEIKGDILIRRCGEKIFDGSDDENWFVDGGAKPQQQGHFRYLVTMSDKRSVNGYKMANFYCDRINIKYSKGLDVTLPELEICDNYGNSIYISGAYSHIGGTNYEEDSEYTQIQKLKSWLKQNPIRVIYELANPYQVLLTEAKIEDVNTTLRRQFKEGNWLRELPNGVKDTIDNYKVVRRVDKLVLNGSEDWKQGLEQTKTMQYIFTKPGYIKTVDLGSILNNRFPVDNYSNYQKDIEFMFYNDQDMIVIGIKKSRLNNNTSVENFKKWLSLNPIDVLIQLQQPKEEFVELSNISYFPIHSNNTYYGNIYITNGRNDLVINNDLGKNGDITVTTPNRKIVNTSTISDCKLKKSPYGSNTPIIVPKGKNCVNLQGGALSNSAIVNEITDNKVVITQPNTYGTYVIELSKTVLPKTTYYLSGTINILENTGGSPYIQIHDVVTDTFILTGFGKFTTPSDVSKLRLYLVGNNHISKHNKVEFVNIQIEKGTVATEFEPFKPYEREFENIKNTELQDLRYLVSLNGFCYEQMLHDSFDKLLQGEL